jgi:uncharacterized membrane protein YraQ (UPF0718 family)
MTDLLFGVLLAGTLTWLIPEDFFLRFAGASTSTPIAAALVLKGVSPALLVTKEETDA